jgi:hypothetical protein
VRERRGERLGTRVPVVVGHSASSATLPAGFEPATSRLGSDSPAERSREVTPSQGQPQGNRAAFSHALEITIAIAEGASPTVDRIEAMIDAALAEAPSWVRAALDLRAELRAGGPLAGRKAVEVAAAILRRGEGAAEDRAAR